MKAVVYFTGTMVLLLVCSCTTFRGVTTVDEPQVLSEPVPIKSLLVTPNKYDGKVISVLDGFDRGTMKTAGNISLSVLYGFDSTMVVLSTKESSSLYSLLVLDKEQGSMLEKLLDLEGKAIAVRGVVVSLGSHGAVLKPTSGFSIQLAE